MTNRSERPILFSAEAIDAWEHGYEQALEDVMIFFQNYHEKYTARQIEVHFAE